MCRVQRFRRERRPIPPLFLSLVKHAVHVAAVNRCRAAPSRGCLLGLWALEALHVRRDRLMDLVQTFAKLLYLLQQLFGSFLIVHLGAYARNF